MFDKKNKKLGEGYINIYKVSEAHNYPVGLNDNRLRVKLLTNHKGLGGNRGEWCITSKVSYIDWSKGIAVTRNSVYIWKVKEHD